MTKLLEVKNLKTEFNTIAGTVKAVDDISYYVDEGEIIGLVGESGCGKSVSQLSVMQLVSTPGKITGGEVIFEGQDLLKYTANSDEMRAIRGGEIAVVFQEPMTSLNPVLTVSRQLTESLELHLNLNKDQSRQRSIELLESVGIPDAENRVDNYPHQFSGGMRQRVMIAMALSCKPKLIIADEPTTALDVTTQAQLFELMTDMCNQSRSTLVIVTHNLGVVARYVHRVYVMYAGKIVEEGTAEDIFLRPKHPYTIALIKSVPRLDEPRGRKLVPILGIPPNLINMSPSCSFRPRCSYRDQCKYDESPPMRHVDGIHYFSCHLDDKEIDDKEITW